MIFILRSNDFHALVSNFEEKTGTKLDDKYIYDKGIISRRPPINIRWD